MTIKLKLTTFAAMGALALGASSVSTARAADSLTIVSWGGAYTESQNEAYHKPYTKKTGVEIINVDKAANGPAGIRSQVQAGNVTWDIVDILEGPAMRLCDEGLVERIDYDAVLAPAPDGTPASKDFLPAGAGCFVPQIVYATLFAYNTTMFPEGKGPKTIKDIFDIEAFPGKRALQKIPAGNLEWALVADGVSTEEVYDVLSTPEGVERAFKKLDSIKDQVIWWEEGAQPPQLLADKEVAIATGYNGRFFNAQVNENQPFELIWDGQLFELDGWAVPKGKLTDQVKDYLRFATSTQQLADQAKYISYGPARESSAPLVGDHAKSGVDMKPHMPTAPENFKTPIKKDAAFWADNGDTLAERFNAWLAR